MKTVAALAVLAAGVANAAHLTPHAAKLWAESGRAKATDRKGFTVGMVMKDAAKLKATLADISNPMSPNYGKWLSAAEANAITATPLNIVAEVYEWATSTGAQCVTKPEALVCDASVAQLEALTGATFSYYTHKESGEIIIRTSMASANAALPTTLAGKVTIVSGLVELPMRERAGRRAPKPEAGDYYIVRAIELAYTTVPPPLFDETALKLPNRVRAHIDDPTKPDHL